MVPQELKTPLEIVFKESMDLQNYLNEKQKLINSAMPHLKSSDVRSNCIGYLRQNVRRMLVLSQGLYGLEVKLNSQIEFIDFHQSEVFLRFHFFLSIFSSFESNIRIIMRHVLQDAYYNKTAISPFLKDIGIKETDSILKLASVIRNTVHNNGLYFPDYKNIEQISINYKNTKFQIKIGEAIEFCYWDLVFSLTKDFVDMLVEVCFSKRVASIDNIDDPLMNYVSFN